MFKRYGFFEGTVGFLTELAKKKLLVDSGAALGSRLVLMSSRTPSPDAFKAALRPGVVVVEYDWDTATAGSLQADIEAAVAKEGAPYDSVCWAQHGPDADATSR